MKFETFKATKLLKILISYHSIPFFCLVLLCTGVVILLLIMLVSALSVIIWLLRRISSRYVMDSDGQGIFFCYQLRVLGVSKHQIKQLSFLVKLV